MKFSRFFAATGVAIFALSACSKPAPPPPPAAEVPAPAAPAPTAELAPAPTEIKAPAGRYEVDPAHSSLSFSVNHLGLSNYVARFTNYKVSIQLDPANLAASKVTATIDPKSVRTDYPGDYRAGHKESKFQTWDEDLAQSDKFLNASAHPQIEFRSTTVEQTGPGTARIAGDLVLLGQTHPVTLDAKLVGSAATHPFDPTAGALGFSATGNFKRSEFGMNHLLQPLLVGDAVTIEFEGEFKQVVAPPATPG